MRLSYKDQADDKALQKNLRTLLLCSQYKSLRYTNLYNKVSQKQREFLQDPQNSDLVDLLVSDYQEQNNTYERPSLEELINSKVSIEDFNLPNELAHKLKVHQDNALRLGYYKHVRNEHNGLRDILSQKDANGKISNKVNLSELKHYLLSKEHTGAFKSFGKEMLQSNSTVALLRYKIAAKKLAKDEEISNPILVDKINQAFGAKELSLRLNREFRGRFTAAGAKVTAIALTAFLAVNGALGLFGAGKNEAEATTGTITSSYTQSMDEGNTLQDNALGEYVNPAVQTEEVAVKAPLSETPSIDTYEGAAKDLFNKVEEIYKYNTNGEEVNLSNLKYENIGEAGTAVLVANYNGKEYRFSTMSNFRTNRTNLERALEAAGATFTSYSTNISYLTRDGESIAIVDSQGNPVQSGKVLESSYGGGTEMYNQSWVNASRNMMTENGIDPTGKSEAELIGYYLLNSEPKQNEELSRALGVVSPLIHYMKSTFYYRSNGNSDPYTVQQYRAKANKITEEFNNAALGITPEEQTQDRDER